MLTPFMTAGTPRVYDEDVEASEYNVPAGIAVSWTFNHEQNREDLLGGNPAEFNPHRWLKESVAERKAAGCPRLDHKMMAKPFGFGPRMCLGFQLAENEIRAMLCRMFQDWEITVDVPEGEEYVPSPRFMTGLFVEKT